jgi:4-alpha-glucanotransferase
VLDAARAELGELPVIAEDLGVITRPVRALRDRFGLPGMAVMIWAFSGRRESPHRPENHRPHQVVYTSTHDSDTLAGMFGVDDAWPMLERALGSVCALAIVPVQDVLGLGSEARMNRPGTTRGNWSWRLEPGQLTSGHATRLRRAAEKTARTENRIWSARSAGQPRSSSETALCRSMSRSSAITIAASAP